MRVTIKGLTDSTITLNSIGIIIRGNSAKMEQYPSSVAKCIDIKNDDQLRELITLKNARLIDYIDENLPIQSTQPKNNGGMVKYSFTPSPVQTVDTSAIKFVAPIEEIEDMPPRQNDSFNTEEEMILPKKASKKGRPKGSTKAAMKKKEMRKLNRSIVKTEDLSETHKASKTIKPIKKLGNVKSLNASPVTPSKPVSTSVDGDGNPIPTEQPDPNYGKIEEDDSNIVVMTPSGAIKGEMINNMAGELEESEATLASIEALKKLDAEENEPEVQMDESKFDDNEKMGGAAVIATGDSKIHKVSMKNSILPEADVTKKKPIQWIDPNGNDGTVEEKPDNKVKNAFISNDGDPNGVDDSFIEH